MSRASSKRLAEVLRGYWQDYETKGVPLLDDLMQQTTYYNPGLRDQEVAAGMSRVNQAIDVSGRNQMERLRGYGIELTPEQKADSDRLQGLTRTTALTDAANRITQHLIDRNRAIATGGATDTVYRGSVEAGQAGALMR